MQKHGKLHCEVSGGERNGVLLTHTVSSMDNFTMKVNIENLQPENRSDTSGWVGFQIGLKGAFNDYRDDAVHGRGLCLGLTNNGKLFIGDHHQFSLRAMVPFPFNFNSPDLLLPTAITTSRCNTLIRKHI